MALAAERNAQKKNGSTVVDNNISIALPEVVQIPAASDPTVKKVSRLKHFFSPIRKKSVTAPIPPPIISQPDVFISNMLPNNLYVNPTMLPSNGVNKSTQNVVNHSTTKPGNI